MPCRVILLEQSGSPLEMEVGCLVAADQGIVCERRGAGQFRPEEIAGSPSRVVMAIALSNTEALTAFLQGVGDLCRGKALIAVLPSVIDRAQLEAVDNLVDDFVLWPAQVGELGRRILRLSAGQGWDAAAVSERMIQEIGLSQLVGQHPAFIKVVERMPLIAKSGAPVLITGETGTGKELSARAIHHLSSRRDFAFIAVDCGILPDHLVENELFGHAKGAFTDAHRDQQGLILMANKGTLFLDEIDALPLATQAKLLRFLQERIFKPLGSERFMRVDINVIAATNRDLESCVARKEFRSDLYYRLNVFRLRLPPLRERSSDISLLARRFIADLSDQTPRKTLSAGALRKLERYDWPGNIRELFNVMQQAVVFSKGSHILPEDILLPETQEPPESGARSFREGRTRTIEAFERAYVSQLLKKNAGNVSRAASEAQKDRRTFGRLIKKYNIDRTLL